MALYINTETQHLKKFHYTKAHITASIYIKPEACFFFFLVNKNEVKIMIYLIIFYALVTTYDFQCRCHISTKEKIVAKQPHLDSFVLAL